MYNELKQINMKTLFHLSLPCTNTEETKGFYLETVGAVLGRHSNNWVDINLFGHQITFTQAAKFNFNNPNYVFEGKILPSFHFGIILNVEEWGRMYSKLNELNLELVTQATFLKNKSGEHLSFFVKDPNGYMLEFKSFNQPQEVFKV